MLTWSADSRDAKGDLPQPSDTNGNSHSAENVDGFPNGTAMKKSNKSSVIDFLSQNSTHGLGEIARTKGKLRVFWILVEMAALVATTYGVVGIIIEFHTHPVITTYDVYSEESLPLPSLTVCVEHPISAQKVRRLKLHPSVVTKFSNTAHTTSRLRLVAAALGVDGEVIGKGQELVDVVCDIGTVNSRIEAHARIEAHPSDPLKK